MNKPLAIAGGLVAAFAIWTVYVANNPVAQEKSKARAAIADCRKATGDDLMPRESRLLARGACEKMESDFQAKYRATP
jgi:hypothetical protein